MSEIPGRDITYRAHTCVNLVHRTSQVTMRTEQQQCGRCDELMPLWAHMVPTGCGSVQTTSYAEDVVASGIKFDIDELWRHHTLPQSRDRAADAKRARPRTRRGRNFVTEESADEY